MGKYAYLDQLEVKKDQTSSFPIQYIRVNGKTPRLIGRPATDKNPGYYNELLKRSFKYAKQIQAGQVTSEQLEENRDEDRQLYPEYVITGWENVVDESGTAVKFSAKECAEFLSSLPDWIFDEVRGHFANPLNFVGTVNLTHEQVETKAKN